MFKLLKIMCLALCISILTVAPVLTYNYLLNKEKGITDYYFSTIAGIGTNQIYAGQQGHGWSATNLYNITINVFKSILRFDFILLLLGIIGIYYAWKKTPSEKDSTLLCLLTIIFLVGYLAGRTGSSTHYVWIPLILSIFAGYSLIIITPHLTKYLKFKHIFTIILILALINSVVIVTKLIPEKKTSISIALQEYSQENIPSNAIIVLDPRIYRGVFAWSFYDKHYLEGTYFPKLMEAIQQDALQKDPAQKSEIPLYYIECGPGTYCGWKPEDYNRISPFANQLSQTLTSQMQKIQELHAIDTLIIYKGAINAPLSIYEPIDRTHTHWYTPVGWKYTDQAIDNYTPKTFFDKTLNALSFGILYFDVLIALLSPFFVFFLTLKSETKNQSEEKN